MKCPPVYCVGGQKSLYDDDDDDDDDDDNIIKKTVSQW